MADNRLREKINAREVMLTGMTRFSNPAYAAIMARSGYDAVCIDNEHYPFTDDQMINIARAVHENCSNCTVRLAEKRPDLIYRALDMDMDGIYLPNVETKEEAEAVVNAAFYPPKGRRGCCPITAGAAYGVSQSSAMDYYVSANERMTVSLMIESKKGHENLDGILSVPGIDIIAMGPSDFSGSYGCPGCSRPDIMEAMEDVYVRARKAGIICETSAHGPEQVLEGAAKGDVCMYLDSDQQIFSKCIPYKEKRNAPLKKLLSGKEPLNMITLTVPEPSAAEICALKNVDIIALNYCSYSSDRELVATLRAVHARHGNCLIRVAAEEVRFIHHLMDMGFDGVIAAGIKSYEEAVRAAESCFFAPVGNRGFFPESICAQYGRMSADECNGSIVFAAELSSDIEASEVLRIIGDNTPDIIMYGDVGSDIAEMVRTSGRRYLDYKNSDNGDIDFIGYDMPLVEHAFREYVDSIRAVI